MSDIFKLNVKDFFKGLVMAVLSAIIVALYQIVIVSGFDIFTVDWSAIVHNIANITSVVFITYLFKNLITDSQGKIAGVFPTK